MYTREKAIKELLQYAVSENDLDDVPECFWPEEEFFKNLYIEDIPLDFCISIQVGNGYPELNFGYFKDARIYILDSEIGVLIRHFYNKEQTPLNQSALIKIFEGLVINGNLQNIKLTYKDNNAPNNEEYLEYFVYGEPGENLVDLIENVKQSILSLEKSFDEKVDAFNNLYNQTIYSGCIVDPARCQAVDEATSTKEKGEILEALIRDCFWSVGGLKLSSTNMRTETQEIDIVLENLTNASTWSKYSSLVLVECKNWSGRVGRAELDAFENKIKDRNGTCRVGFFVAWRGVTDDFKKQLLRISREPYNIIVLDGEGIKNAIKNGGFSQYLESMYQESVK